MSSIRISKHALTQMRERGVSETEIIETIKSGEKLFAKLGRKKFLKNFPFDKFWAGHFYRTKQVVPVTIEEGADTIVITVYSFYF